MGVGGELTSIRRLSERCNNSEPTRIYDGFDHIKCHVMLPDFFIINIVMKNLAGKNKNLYCYCSVIMIGEGTE